LRTIQDIQTPGKFRRCTALNPSVIQTTKIPEVIEVVKMVFRQLTSWVKLRRKIKVAAVAAIKGKRNVM
jgi:hypothetical protein